MPNAFTPIGNTTRLTPAAGVNANVGNVSTRTNTFHVLNASSTVYTYVGIFNNYTDAAAMDYPTVGSDAGGIPLAPNESMSLAGNFGEAGIPANGNVYVAAITATGSTTVFFTPIAE